MRSSLVLLLVLISFCLAEVRPNYKFHSGPLSADELEAARVRKVSNANGGSLNYFFPANKIRAFYNIPSDPNSGAGKTIAVVDAYGASTAEADLSAFAADNGLPAITSQNFRKVDQNGGTNYPKDDPEDKNGGGWGAESALDLQAAHLFAPGAKKILVVAKDATNANLKKAVAWAAANADYVSMSFSEAEGSAFLDTIFAQGIQNGVSFFASSGDDGSSTGVGYPASSQYVIAVGGTSLYTNSDGSLASEQAWSGSGGGCSKLTRAVPEQVANSGYASLKCNGFKAVPDVSSLADPKSGIVINFRGNKFAIGGTSLASPLIAGLAATLGHQVTPAYIYTSGQHFRDITQGSNGGFSAKIGLDLVTGEGSWLGSQ